MIFPASAKPPLPPIEEERAKTGLEGGLAASARGRGGEAKQRSALIVACATKIKGVAKLGSTEALLSPPLQSSLYACLTCSNLSLLPPGLSGWHLEISLRYRLRASFNVQSSLSPSTSRGVAPPLSSSEESLCRRPRSVNALQRVGRPRAGQGEVVRPARGRPYGGRKLLLFLSLPTSAAPPTQVCASRGPVSFPF